MAAAYKCLVLFMAVYCARPGDWVPGLSAIPLAKISGFFALASFGLSIAFTGRGVLRLPRETWYLILLLGQMSLAAVFSPVWRGGALQVALGDFPKVVLITIVITLTATNLLRLRRLLFVQTCSAVIIALVSIVKFPLVSGRLTSVVGGIYGNPNELAIVAALAFPFCFAFVLGTASLIRKFFWAFAMLVITCAVLFTYSRAGLLALLTAVGICVWEFCVIGKRPGLLLLAAIVGLAIILLAAPARYATRVRSIVKPGEDPTGSAEARRALLVRSLEITAQHPLLGVGPGNFQVLSGNWHDTHNSYTQMSSEAGVLALIFFLAILRRSLINVREVKRLANGKAELLLAGGLRASLLAFAVGSFFGSLAYHFFPYFLVGYASALGRFAQGNHTPQAEPSFSGPTAAVGRE
jgi:O-antigen ligase